MRVTYDEQLATADAVQAPSAVDVHVPGMPGAGSSASGGGRAAGAADARAAPATTATVIPITAAQLTWLRLVATDTPHGGYRASSRHPSLVALERRQLAAADRAADPLRATWTITAAGRTMLLAADGFDRAQPPLSESRLAWLRRCRRGGALASRSQPVLRRLADDGLVEHRFEPGRAPRVRWVLTPAGIAHVEGQP